MSSHAAAAAESTALLLLTDLNFSACSIDSAGLLGNSTSTFGVESLTTPLARVDSLVSTAICSSTVSTRVDFDSTLTEIPLIVWCRLRVCVVCVVSLVQIVDWAARAYVLSE